jgi:hypothetical protein
MVFIEAKKRFTPTYNGVFTVPTQVKKKKKKKSQKY